MREDAPEQPVRRPPPVRWDDEIPDLGSSTYTSAIHGPDPVPAWVITDDAAVQTDLGVLKTGKEADVHLIERQLGARTNLLAAKRYRGFDRRTFRNDARYREGRAIVDDRVKRAVHRNTAAGRAFRAWLWIDVEFDTLSRLWLAGAAVPYPVQRSQSEIVLELVTDADGLPAPRLAQAQVPKAQLPALFEQLIHHLCLFANQRVVHGDLSPYNILLQSDRLVFIDFPQAVDPMVNPNGLDLLKHDVEVCCAWFVRRGLDVDVDAVYRDIAVEAVMAP